MGINFPVSTWRLCTTPHIWWSPALKEYWYHSIIIGMLCLHTDIHISIIYLAMSMLSIFLKFLVWSCYLYRSLPHYISMFLSLYFPSLLTLASISRLHQCLPSRNPSECLLAIPKEVRYQNVLLPNCLIP